MMEDFIFTEVCLVVVLLLVFAFTAVVGKRKLMATDEEEKNLGNVCYRIALLCAIGMFLICMDVGKKINRAHAHAQSLSLEKEER